MRTYKPKDDVQAKPYYTDRFYVSPQVPKQDVSSDEVFVLQENFTIHDAYIQIGQMVVYINACDNYKVLELLRDKLDYTQLSEMSAIDWLAKQNQFEVFYQLLSMEKRKRIRIKCFIDKDEAINSVEKLFRSADWSEREMYDMFGIKANNHPFLKRILMPYDWEGYPLLKTYPLEGDEFAAWYEVDNDRYDSERFARLGHEVPKGAKITGNEPKQPLAYQEDGGVFMVDKFDENKSIIITDRDR